MVSGEAEADFDKGYGVNLDGTRALLEAVRAAHAADGYHPRLVFTSSIAVYGAPLPNPIPEDFHLTPLTSYGTQKAIGELLLADYTRRGFVDGIGIRLPTICIRPGATEPGRFRVLLQHPARAAGRAGGGPAGPGHGPALARLAPLSRGVPGPGGHARRSAGRPPTDAVHARPQRHRGEQIEALRRVAGEQAVRLIRREPDESIMRIVESWAPALEATRALRLGFAAESSFDEIIRVHIEDELGGSL